MANLSALVHPASERPEPSRAGGHQPERRRRERRQRPWRSLFIWAVCGALAMAAVGLQVGEGVSPAGPAPVAESGVAIGLLQAVRGGR